MFSIWIISIICKGKRNKWVKNKVKWKISSQTVLTRDSGETGVGLWVVFKVGVGSGNGGIRGRD